MKQNLILTAIALLFSLSLSQAKEGKGKKGHKKHSVDQVIEKLDTDGDGALSREEFLSSKRSQKRPGKAEKRFEKMDTNDDDILTKEEMEEARAQRKAEREEAKEVDPQP